MCQRLTPRRQRLDEVSDSKEEPRRQYREERWPNVPQKNTDRSEACPKEDKEREVKQRECRNTTNPPIGLQPAGGIFQPVSPLPEPSTNRQDPRPSSQNREPSTVTASAPWRGTDSTLR